MADTPEVATIATKPRSSSSFGAAPLHTPFAAKETFQSFDFQLSLLSPSKQMAHIPQLDKSQAQLLMSQLIDGELSPQDAERLSVYLELHPDEMDWMEGLDAVREKLSSPIQTDDREAARASIFEALQPTAPRAKRRGELLSFPGLLRPLAAAAAIAIVGALTWIGVQPQGDKIDSGPAVVEFVATGIPDSSTFIYSDEESGWTVVWVESNAASDHG